MNRLGRDCAKSMQRAELLQGLFNAITDDPPTPDEREFWDEAEARDAFYGPDGDA